MRPNFLLPSCIVLKVIHMIFWMMVCQFVIQHMASSPSGPTQQKRPNEESLTPTSPHTPNSLHTTPPTSSAQSGHTFSQPSTLGPHTPNVLPASSPIHHSSPAGPNPPTAQLHPSTQQPTTVSSPFVPPPPPRPATQSQSGIFKPKRQFNLNTTVLNLLYLVTQCLPFVT